MNILFGTSEVDAYSENILRIKRITFYSKSKGLCFILLRKRINRSVRRKEQAICFCTERIFISLIWNHLYCAEQFLLITKHWKQTNKEQFGSCLLKSIEKFNSLSDERLQLWKLFVQRSTYMVEYARHGTCRHKRTNN